MFPQISCRFVQLVAGALVLFQPSYGFYPFHFSGLSPADLSSSLGIKPGLSVRAPSLKLNLSLKTIKRENSFKVIPAATPATPNSAGIHHDEFDYSYFCSVQFAPNGKTFYLLLDTAAANTWIMGHDCTTAACEPHSTLDPAVIPSLKVCSTQGP